MYKQYAVYAFNALDNQTLSPTLDKMFNNYHHAWDYMNELCQEHSVPPMELMPKREVPLRQEGFLQNVELWIINRTAE